MRICCYKIQVNLKKVPLCTGSSFDSKNEWVHRYDLNVNGTHKFVVSKKAVSPIEREKSKVLAKQQCKQFYIQNRPNYSGAVYSGASKTPASFHTNDKETRVVCSGHGSTGKVVKNACYEVFNDASLRSLI